MSGNLFTGRVVGNDPNNTVDLIGTVLVNGQPIGTGTIIIGPPGATGAPGVDAIGTTGATGATGPQGLQGPQGINGINAVSPSGLIWRGNWNATYSYAINDSVGYNGASWFAIDNVTARPTPLTPNIPPDVDTSHWALLAMQGSQGPQGPQGIPGLPGPTGPAGSGSGGDISGTPEKLAKFNVTGNNVEDSSITDGISEVLIAKPVQIDSLVSGKSGLSFKNLVSDPASYESELKSSTTGLSARCIIEKNGKLYISSYHSYKLSEYSDGVTSLLGQFAPNVSPNDVVAGSDGNFYSSINDYGGTIMKVTPAGVVSTFATTGRVYPNKMIQSTDGNFYVVHSYNEGATILDGVICKITPSGVVTSLTVLNGQGGAALLQKPGTTSLYVTSSTGLYLVEDTGVISTLATNSDINTYTLGLDSANNLYFSDNSHIYKITPDGVISTFFDTIAMTYPGSFSIYADHIYILIYDEVNDSVSLYKISCLTSQSELISSDSVLYDAASIYANADGIYVAGNESSSLILFTLVESGLSTLGITETGEVVKVPNVSGLTGATGPQGIPGPTGPAGSGGGSGSSVIENDITVRLFDNKTLGKYKNGDIIPSAGKTFEEVLNDIAYEYQEPSFDYFETNYSLVEVGTTFSDVSFYWNLLQNDGVVDDVTIHDNINDTDLITVPNSDGYVNIPYDKMFSYEGDNISFKAIANNTSPIGTSDSKDTLVRSGYYFGYGGINEMPADTNDGTANRDYLFNEVKNTDIIETPLVYVTDFDFKVVLDMFYFSKFTVILPKYTTYRYEFKVWDDINGVDLTSYYLNTNELIIKDAAGNDIYYDQYVYEIGIPYYDADYDTDFTHTITIHGHSGS